MRHGVGFIPNTAEDLPVREWIAHMGQPGYTENTFAKLNRLVGGSLDSDAVVADYGNAPSG